MMMTVSDAQITPNSKEGDISYIALRLIADVALANQNAFILILSHLQQKIFSDLTERNVEEGSTLSNIPFGRSDIR